MVSTFEFPIFPYFASVSFLPPSYISNPRHEFREPAPAGFPLNPPCSRLSINRIFGHSVCGLLFSGVYEVDIVQGWVQIPDPAPTHESPGSFFSPAFARSRPGWVSAAKTYLVTFTSCSQPLRPFPITRRYLSSVVHPRMVRFSLHKRLSGLCRVRSPPFRIYR